MHRTTSPLRGALASVGPGWFTSVMGTGIVGICFEIEPYRSAVTHALALAFFTLDAVLFVLFAALWAVTTIRDPGRIARSLRDTAQAQLWGAPPMACFTVAVGLLDVGATVLPHAPTVAAAQVAFALGVVGSLFSAFVVPYLMFSEHELAPDRAFGSWLLPVVPPIVASVPAALLSPTWHAAWRPTMLAGAYGLLGIGVLLAAILIVIFYSRLLFHKLPDAALVPTMWIVVGPLGQSVAGIVALGRASRAVFPTFGHGLLVAGIAYGMLVWGFGCYWLAMALVTTVRTARVGLPFSLGWWAFTFPVGTLTTGSFGLAVVTGAPLFAAVGTALLALLGCMWTLVAGQTVRGLLRNRRRSEALRPIAIVA